MLTANWKSFLQLSTKFILDQKKNANKFEETQWRDFWMGTDDSNEDYKREEVTIIDLVKG